MAILSAMQSAAIRLVGRKPAVFFSATASFELEIADLINEVAKDICKSHDWQALTKIATLTGDGTTTAFDLPSDYDRMLVKSDMQDVTNWAWGYLHVLDINEWISLNRFGWTPNPGIWSLFGGQFQFVPAPQNATQAQFPYISKNYALAKAGTAKSAFSADDDTFKINDRLLTLGLVWKWREMKRLDATTDQANFVKAIDEVAGRDKGSRVLYKGPARFPANVTSAYPLVLG